MQKEYLYYLSNSHLLSNSLTQPVFQFFFQPINEKIAYQAGQYIEIRYPDGSFQPFSIANAPRSDGILELLVRFHKDDLLHQHFFHHLNAIKKICLIGPFGHCTSKKLLHKPTLLLSGGVGFSQSKAIIEALILEKHAQSIHFYWGVKNPQGIFLEKHLIKWKNQLSQFQFTEVFSEPQVYLGPHQANGYVHAAVAQDYPNLKNYQLLVSGPKEMAYAAKALLNQGLSKEHLYSDWFYFL